MSKSKIPKHLFTYFIASIAILVIFLDIFNITNESIISEVIVAVLAILIFTLLRLEDKIDKLMSNEKVEGIKNFRLNRENIPTLESLFAIADEEIIIWGSALYTVHSRSDLILNKINQGCKVKILMMSLVDKSGNPNPILDEYQKSTKHAGFRDRIPRFYRDLQDEFFISTK